MNQPFRILSLAGGGIRGIYQATYLRRVHDIVDKKSNESFDLICGTSTGAIVAMAAALGIDMAQIEDLYHKEGNKIFTKKKPLLSGFFPGSLYDAQRLHSALERVFGSTKLKDVKTKVLITASSIGQSSIEIFNNFDGVSNEDISIVDVIMSSTAAPTYFPAHKIKGRHQSFIDGGLWANSPSSVGILYAQKHLNTLVSDIRLLSIGTTQYKELNSSNEHNRMRLYSIKTVKKVIDLFFCTQEDYDDHYVKHVLGDNYIKINSDISKRIALDDAPSAFKYIPQLAEKKAEDSIAKVKTLFFNDILNSSPQPKPKRKNILPESHILEAGLSGFYSSREYYHYRGAKKFSDYIKNAKKTLTLINVSLSRTEEFDVLASVFLKKIEEENVKITISLLNPYREYLLLSIKDVLNWKSDGLNEYIIESARKLLDLRKKLSENKKNNLELRFHNSVPFGSAIIMDEDDPEEASIQVETKAYKAPSGKSFSFELVPQAQDGLFHSLVTGYKKLISDGEKMRISTNVQINQEKEKLEKRQTPIVLSRKKPKRVIKRP